MMFLKPKIIRSKKDVLDTNSFIHSIYGKMKCIRVYKCKECWFYYLTFNHNDKKYCYKYHYETVNDRTFKNNYLRDFAWINPLRYIICKKCKG